MNKIELITIEDIAFDFLQDGTINGYDFSQFNEELYQKYHDKDIYTLYQSKLDMLSTKSVNSDTKGGLTHAK